MRSFKRTKSFQLESLESRRLLSALTVSSAADSGIGSLRAQIAAAQSGDTINFAPNLAGQTIELTSGSIVFDKSLTVQGLGANQLTILGWGGPRIFRIGSTSQVAIRDLTITGVAGITGGAIYNIGTLTISGCTLSGHSSVYYYAGGWSGGPGGAIYNTGTLIVSNSTLSGNDAADSNSASDGAGGAIYNAGTLTVSGSNLSGNRAGYGGGGAIYNSFGTATISDSNLSDNTAYVGGGAISIFGGAVTVSNCTIANNHAIGVSNAIYDDDGNVIGWGGSGAHGGGIFVAGTLSIDHSTLAGNFAGPGADPGDEGRSFGGAIYGGAIQLYNTIIADNNAYVAPDLYGSVTSVGHNLIGNSTDAGGFLASDQLDVDPHLGPLQNNGGPTETIALLAGSPAINGGDNTDAPAYDQRGAGFGRIVGGTIDVGAFESDNGPDYTGLRINNATATEGNTGTVDAAVIVTLLAPATSAVTVDFATSDGSATVAGGDYLATSGTLTFTPGQTTQTIFIPVNGDRIAETDEQFYVNLTGASNAYLFDAQGIVTIVDDEPRVSITDASVTEGNTGTSPMIFSVTLSAAYDVTTTVDFETSDGSATVGGADYLATSETIPFTPGQTSKTISIPVNGDRIAEDDEQFYVNLSSPSNGFLIDEQGVATIVDDEPRVSISDATVTEGNSGTTPMAFTVTLSAAYDIATSVNFSTAGGSAISGKDFDAGSGTVTFLPGQTSQTLSVAVRGDVIDEYDESFTVTLSGASNGLILNAQATGTIVDDDAPPSLVVRDVSRAEGNSGTTPFTFTISLLTPSEKYVSVQYATANGSATSSTAANKQDYLPASGYAYINSDAQSAMVTVQVRGDTRNESDETFFLNLSNAGNAAIADAQGVGTILNDDGGRGKTWVGPASGGSWGTAANWSPSGVPVTDSLVMIPGAAVTLSANASVSELSLGDGASLSIAAAGNRVLRTSTFFVGAESKLNLNDNDLLLDYSGGTGATPMNDVIAMIVQGRGASPTGIYSPPANASGNLYALGVAEASQVLGISGMQTKLFDGQTVDATTALVKFTYGGDANLDGKINVDDYGKIDFNVPLGASGWFNGDFNYDGKINVDDYGIIDFNVGIQGPPLPSAAPSGEGEETASGSPALPLLSKTLPSLEPRSLDRDVFDSIFSTTSIL